MKNFEKNVGKKVFIYKIQASLKKLRLIKERGIIVDFLEKQNKYVIFRYPQKYEDSEKYKKDLATISFFDVNDKNNYYKLLENVVLDDNLFHYSSEFFSFIDYDKNMLLNKLKEEASKPHSQGKTLKVNILHEFYVHSKHFDTFENFKNNLFNCLFSEVNFDKLVFSKRFQESLKMAYTLIKEEFHEPDEALIISFRVPAIKNEYGFIETTYFSETLKENKSDKIYIDAKIYLRNRVDGKLCKTLVNKLYKKHLSKDNKDSNTIELVEH